MVFGLGIICGPIWESFAVLGSFAGWEHLRARTVLIKYVEMRVNLLCDMYRGTHADVTIYINLLLFHTTFRTESNMLDTN